MAALRSRGSLLDQGGDGAGADVGGGWGYAGQEARGLAGDQVYAMVDDGVAAGARREAPLRDPASRPRLRQRLGPGAGVDLGADEDLVALAAVVGLQHPVAL